MTHSSPSSAALVCTLARSEPAPGSLNPWHQISSPDRMRGRNRCFCSGLPWAISVGPGVLVFKQDTLRDGRRAAAVLLRPAEARPASGMQFPLPLDPQVVELLILRAALADQDGEPPGEVLVQPFADLGRECQVRRGELQVHTPLPFSEYWWGAAG